MAAMLAAGLGGGSGAISASSALDPDNLDVLSPSPESGKLATTGGEGVTAHRLRSVTPSKMPWLTGDFLSDFDGVGGIGGVGLNRTGCDVLLVVHESTVICFMRRDEDRGADFGLGSFTIVDNVVCLLSLDVLLFDLLSVSTGLSSTDEGAVDKGGSVTDCVLRIVSPSPFSGGNETLNGP